MATLRQRFGDRLRDLRLEQRMTQDEFAERLGLSADFLSMIERGVNSPSFDKLEIISSKLEMTVSKLFDFGGQPGTRKRAKKPRKRTRSAKLEK